MTQCKRPSPVLKRLGRRAVEIDFAGGTITSDAGFLLLRQVDSQLGLLDAINDLPLYVFCGSRPLVAYLRSSNINAAKAEHTDRGENPRFVVTNLFDEVVPEKGSASPAVDPGKFYDECYCVRGEMENRIQEQQLGGPPRGATRFGYV